MRHEPLVRDVVLVDPNVFVAEVEDAQFFAPSDPVARLR
jgi:hypothetical protein